MACVCWVEPKTCGFWLKSAEKGPKLGPFSAVARKAQEGLAGLEKGPKKAPKRGLFWAIFGKNFKKFLQATVIRVTSPSSFGPFFSLFFRLKKAISFALAGANAKSRALRARPGLRSGPARPLKPQGVFMGYESWRPDPGRFLVKNRRSAEAFLASAIFCRKSPKEWSILVF